MKREKSDPFVEVLEWGIGQFKLLGRDSSRTDVQHEALGIAREFEMRVAKHRKITERAARREEAKEAA